MQPFTKILSRKNLRFFCTRFMISGLVLVIYILIWRPIRVAATEDLVHPQVEEIESNSNRYNTKLNNGALNVEYQYGEVSKKLQYRPEFGFFFLVALLSLFFVSNVFWHYGLLAGIHLVATVSAYLSLMLGVLGMPIGFVLTDAISGYLTPALSLALIPLIMKGMLRAEKLRALKR